MSDFSKERLMKLSGLLKEQAEAELAVEAADEPGDKQAEDEWPTNRAFWNIHHSLMDVKSAVHSLVNSQPQTFGRARSEQDLQTTLRVLRDEINENAEMLSDRDIEKLKSEIIHSVNFNNYPEHEKLMKKLERNLLRWLKMKTKKLV